MKRRARVLILLVAVSSMGAALPAVAVVSEPYGAELYREREGISADEAASIVRSSYGGRVVSVKAAGNGGWKVRVLLDGGRVKTVNVDSSGSIRSSD